MSVQCASISMPRSFGIGIGIEFLATLLLTFEQMIILFFRFLSLSKYIKLVFLHLTPYSPILFFSDAIQQS